MQPQTVSGNAKCQCQEHQLRWPSLRQSRASQGKNKRQDSMPQNFLCKQSSHFRRIQLFKTPWKFQYLVYKSQLGSSSTSRKGDHPIHNVHTRWHRMKCLPKLCEVWCKLGWSSYSKFSNARWTLLLPLLSLPVSLFFNCEVLPDYKDNSIFLLQRIDLKINICKDGNKKWVTIWRRETNSSVLIKNSPYVII